MLTNCPICSTPDLPVAFSSGKYNIHRCPDCGLGVNDPLPLISELGAMYSAGTYREEEGGRRFHGPLEYLVRRSRQGRLCAIMRYARTGRMLDIGCGRGLMLQEARLSGWEVYGTEATECSARHAREVLGLDVRAADVREAGWEAGSFDVITLWHSLEHMHEPVALVDKCVELLKPGGLLIIAVPNFDSLQAGMSKAEWFHLDLPHHLYHFTMRSLRRLVKDRGMHIVQERQLSIEFGPFGYLQSMLNMVGKHTGIRRNLLYDALKREGLGGESSGTVVETILTVLLMIPLVPLALVLSVTESAIGKGGAIEIWARKQGSSHIS